MFLTVQLHFGSSHKFLYKNINTGVCIYIYLLWGNLHSDDDKSAYTVDKDIHLSENASTDFVSRASFVLHPVATSL